MELDLAVLAAGATYEDRYQGYMKIFEVIARTPESVTIDVSHPPWSWVPLLHHLSCNVKRPRVVFDHCRLVMQACNHVLDRLGVEVLCGFRPECVDALWKCDMQWTSQRVRKYEPQKEFIVTNNGSFHRPEVMEFIHRLHQYKPTKKNVLIVPCAADKPYPAPLHKACLDILPESFYMMNATGVLGLVPQDLWDVMPWYDSGIPNRWRVMKTVEWYFKKHNHDRVVIHSDFYLEAINLGLVSAMGQPYVYNWDSTLEIKPYDDYVDLMDAELLSQLKDLLDGV